MPPDVLYVEDLKMYFLLLHPAVDTNSVNSIGDFEGCFFNILKIYESLPSEFSALILSNNIQTLWVAWVKK